MQGSNGIFNSLRHCIHFALFSDILVTDNSIDGSFYRSEVFVLILVQSVYLGDGCIDFGVVGRQISHCDSMRMSCCISRNRNIGIENLAIICADFDLISTCLQISGVCYYLTVHFDDYICKFSRCYNKRNCILRCRQKGCSIRIKSIIATRSNDFIKEIFRFHKVKGLFFSSILILKASRDIFSFHEIIVFKNRCIRRNTACNTA